MKVKYTIDRGYPHGEQSEIREYEEEELSQKELNAELTDFVMSNTMAHYEVMEEDN